MNANIKITLIIMILFFSVGLASAEGNFTTLQTEITAAQGSSNVLFLEKDYKYNGTPDTTLIINKDNFVLDGNNHTLDGDGQIRVLTINGNNVTIKNLKIINGFNNAGTALGGAIYAIYGLNIYNSTFINNKATNGGAVYTTSTTATLNIVDSTFINNTAANNGGAIRSNIAIITNSIFENNKATNNGGAIYGNGNSTIINSIFTNNSATTYDGGAIYANSYLTVKNSTFMKNRANDGGAIYTATTNRAVINNSIFLENGVINNGGAVRLNIGTITNSIFKNNTATNGNSIYGRSSSQITANYNLILDNNPIYVYTSVAHNFNFNWWGTNDITKIKAGITGTSSLNYILTNFYVMNITSNIVNPTIGHNFSFNYTFTLNGTTTSTGANNLPFFNVTLSINNNIITITDARKNTNQTIEIAALQNNITGSSYDVNIVSLYFTANYGDSHIIIDLSENEIIFGDEITIIIRLLNNNSNGISGQNINITIGGIDYSNITNENGTIIITLIGEKIGVNNITALFEETENYTSSSNKDSFIVLQGIPEINVDYNNITYGENATLNITTIPVVKGNVTITITGRDNKTVNLTDGNLIYTISNLGGGTYNITITFNGNENYTSVNKTIILKVDPSNPQLNISVEDIEFGENAIVKVNLEDITGTVNIQVNNKNYTVDITNGIGEINIDVLPAGNYTVYAKFDGNDNYTPATNNTVSFNVSKSNITLNIPPVINITENTNITLEVPINATGNITLTIDNKTYIQVIENGTVVFDISDLDAGNYTGTITYSGDSNFNELNETFNITLNKGDLILNAENIIMFFRNGTQYIVTVTDINGKLLSDLNITITVNGVPYNFTTNENGTAKLDINLNPGNYTLETLFNGNEKFNKNNITTNLTVLTTIVGNDLTKYFLNDSQYSVTILDGQGQGVNNTVVSFNVNGVIYDITTNEYGVATLDINLNPGNYIITATWNGLSRSNNITVLTTLIGSDLNKTFGIPANYTVKALNNMGEPFANQLISINIHGIFYNITTEADGIARLHIDLSPGSYIVTATWNTYSTSNIINVKTA